MVLHNFTSQLKNKMTLGSNLHSITIPGSLLPFLALTLRLQEEHWSFLWKMLCHRDAMGPPTLVGELPHLQQQEPRINPLFHSSFSSFLTNENNTSPSLLWFQCFVGPCLLCRYSGALLQRLDDAKQCSQGQTGKERTRESRVGKRCPLTYWGGSSHPAINCYNLFPVPQVLSGVCIPTLETPKGRKGRTAVLNYWASRSNFL